MKIKKNSAVIAAGHNEVDFLLNVLHTVKFIKLDACFQMPEKRVLTLNRKHALVAYLLANTEESELSSMICLQIVDLCEMARQPLMAERMVEFLNRSNKLLSLLAQK